MAPTSKSKVYIAGVGFTPSTTSSASGNTSANNEVSSLISAATKALLDAGITYDDVTHGVRSQASKHVLEAFQAFDDGGVDIKEAEDGPELDKSSRLIKDQGAQCVLLVGVGKRGVTALVLVSENFLWRRPYLKDSSALLSVSKQPGSDSNSGDGDLRKICHIVWSLRGWSKDKNQPSDKTSSRFSSGSGITYDLVRADNHSIPKWKDVEHKQDGKHRLGYNPASGAKEISQEDFDSVRGQRSRRYSHKQHRFERRGGDVAALAKL